MIADTDSYQRRGTDVPYHSGDTTKVLGARMPAWKIDAVDAAAGKRGISRSEYVEWLIDVRLIRGRLNPHTDTQVALGA